MSSVFALGDYPGESKGKTYEEIHIGLVEYSLIQRGAWSYEDVLFQKSPILQRSNISNRGVTISNQK